MIRCSEKVELARIVSDKMFTTPRPVFPVAPTMRNDGDIAGAIVSIER